MKKIKNCIEYSKICNFVCCNQSKESSFLLWMYPGEYENCKLDKSHIKIIKRKNKALIGRCCCSQEKRKMCDGKNWLKPLDCWSYPFFPFIENDTLVLKIDNIRCPMTQDCDLDNHYIQTLKIWQQMIKNEDVFYSLKNINPNDFIFFSSYKSFMK